MNKITIRIDKEGNAFFLYRDEHPLLKIGGSLKVERASNVKFDNALQKWFVHVLDSEGNETKTGPGFESRAQAIGHEIEFLEAEMVLNADFVENFFPKEKDQE